MNPRADYQPALQYIDEYWDKSIFTNKSSHKGNARNILMKIGRIELPNPSVAPNHKYFARTQFYWDSYFIILGLVVSGRAELARGMVDNLCYLFAKMNIIPARNTWLSISRTQPPLLTRMAYEVYEAGGADINWLNKVLLVAQEEYADVWCARDRQETTTGLNRYSPRFFKKLLTVYESGWDVSSRFAKSPESIVPVDLNCLLFQYEADFMKWSRQRGDNGGVKKWKAAMDRRRSKISEFFWDEKEGFYFDYNRKTLSRESLKTLAGFLPLWCGAADEAQARRCAGQLPVFEFAGGLAATQKLPRSLRQWDYPNGWAPLHHFVCKGLEKYGHRIEAKRIAGKWLDCNAKVFERTGCLWEKYDVIRERIGTRGRYPTQPGFGWTNGVFARLAHDMP